MSLLLSWETPPELYDTLFSAVSAELSREFPGTLTAQQVTGDVGWGFYEDETTSDPSVIYTITYKALDGAVSKRIDNHDIRRWVRPANTCRVDFSFRRPDSAPWAGRRVKLLEVPSHSWVRDIWTDRRGDAHVVLEHGAVLRLEVEGLMSALEFVVPRKRGVGWLELQELGSWMRVDERSFR